MEPLYKCRSCGYVCLEQDMEGDSAPLDDGETWTNWICPKCKEWFYGIDSWIPVQEG